MVVYSFVFIELCEVGTITNYENFEIFRISVLIAKLQITAIPKKVFLFFLNFADMFIT